MPGSGSGSTPISPTERRAAKMAGCRQAVGTRSPDCRVSLWLPSRSEIPRAVSGTRRRVSYPHIEQARDADRVSEPADNHNDAPPSKIPGPQADEAAVLMEDDRI